MAPPEPRPALLEKLKELRRLTRTAVRLAADVCEEIDPTFPQWTTIGEPDEKSPELRDALAQLEWLVAMEHAATERMVAVGMQIREAPPRD